MPTDGEINPRDPVFEEGRQRGYEVGLRDGQEKLRKKVLDFLQEKYLGEDSPDRGTPEARALLQFTHDVAVELREALKQ